MKLITNFGVLCRLARAEAEAKKSGDPVLIEKATKAHEEYKELCLKADEMQIGLTFGEL